MTKGPLAPYGPGNPHPLSQMSTQLIWEGKYDEYGDRRSVDMAGAAMPMQRIETIDQPRSEAAAAGQLRMFEQKTRRLDDFRNRLIWGDNKAVMASLLEEFRSAVDLIYIDPPFDVGQDFSMDVPIGEEKETILKAQSTLEMVAYRDMWGRGTDSYLHMMFERLSLMKDLLSERGSIYVHCDWRVTHYLRGLLEDVFGACFVNEIIWRRSTAHSDAQKFGQVHDTIYVFSRSEHPTWIPQYRPYEKEYVDQYFRFREKDGRRYWKEDASGAGSGPPRRFGTKMISPPAGRHWRWKQETIDEYWAAGRFELTSSGRPEFKRYLDEQEGEAVSDVWDDIKRINQVADERLGYDTQKPEALLERVIRASTGEGHLVADFFCGSGTTGAVAERLGRRWIMADLGRFAIHTSRKRLIDLQRRLHQEERPYRAFDVHNLGRYERQWWQRQNLSGADEEHRRVVLEFFRAEILANTPSPLLHGKRAGAFCHVDGIDSVFTREEARVIAKAVMAAGGRECYCLAWEFEMDLRLTTAALEQEYGVKLKLIQIPREIMERNRKSPPPFLEMALLEADIIRRGKDADRFVDVKLTKFLPSLAEVPSRELEALRERATTSGFDFIDFWAVDFDWHPERPFNHHWQDYRTRKDRTLKTVSDAGYKYAAPGIHTICVKVVDVFGCDTSVSLKVTV